MVGELALAVLSILIGCWVLEQTRQERHANGYKVCRCVSIAAALGAPWASRFLKSGMGKATCIVDSVAYRH